MARSKEELIADSVGAHVACLKDKHKCYERYHEHSDAWEKDDDDDDDDAWINKHREWEINIVLMKGILNKRAFGHCLVPPQQDKGQRSSAFQNPRKVSE
ncbi:unnamed protein product [Sphenostylis stenocarpa]|uniref:Uncharacterized protein n=1 Tax=Sphenostylis stenocarpa TaxID=92480 RepID=A0AA86SS75_9FABA|nr:unnamed protein product [Sphenostylis stenocarpa]